VVKIERYYICVYGLVQGVGFRYFVYCNALELGVTGWVKNLDNGNVEIEIQGKPENLRLLIKQIRKGPKYSVVEKVRAKKIRTKNESKFRMAN